MCALEGLRWGKREWLQIGGRKERLRKGEVKEKRGLKMEGDPGKEEGWGKREGKREERRKRRDSRGKREGIEEEGRKEIKNGEKGRDRKREKRKKGKEGRIQ